MATRDCERDLVEALSPLVAAAVEGLIHELVVSDSGSTDATLAILDEAGAVMAQGGLEGAVAAVERGEGGGRRPRFDDTNDAPAARRTIGLKEDLAVKAEHGIVHHQRAAGGGKPRRSFDLREKPLFDQLDGEEIRALRLLAHTLRR